MALPLNNRGRCIGALTVQSSQEAAFSLAISRFAVDEPISWPSPLQRRLYDEVQHYATRLEERVAERTAALAVVNKELEALPILSLTTCERRYAAWMALGQALLEDYAGQHDPQQAGISAGDYSSE